MRISNLDYINDLTKESTIRGGALIPTTSYSEFLDSVFLNLSQSFSDFRDSRLSSANTGEETSFSSLFANISARMGSGGVISTSSTIDLTSPPQGTVIRREAPIPS